MGQAEEGPYEANQIDEFALSDEQLYLEERAKLLRRRDELGDTFDKGRVALAGGAIALIVSVSKDSLKSMVLSERAFLAIGLLMLTSSMLCAVFAVYRAGLAYDRQVDILDADRMSHFEQRRAGPRNRKNTDAIQTHRLNRASLWLLSVGLVVSGIGLFTR